MYTQMLFNAYRGQNRASESQELELQAVESSANVGAGNQRWVLCKSNKHSKLGTISLVQGLDFKN